MEKLYIGVDVGGTFTKGGLFKNGELLERFQVPSSKGSLDSVFAIVDKASAQGQASGIGISMAGLVSNRRILLNATNLGLENIDVAGILEKKYNVPVAMENDVSCFALAEAAASGLDDLVFLALGTGINIGVIKNGVLLGGLEYGHTFFMPSNSPCACGLSGCVEQYISGKALQPNSKNLPNEFLTNLSIVLLNIANSYRPQKIFIGGGLAALVAPHIKRLNYDLKSKNYGYKNAPAVTVEISKLSTDGAIIGAAELNQKD